MSRWLARLSLSFIIIAMVLLYEVWKGTYGHGARLPAWRAMLYLVAAVLALVLGLAGVRQRHRGE